MKLLNKESTKEDVVSCVDEAGTLHFDSWYKNQLTYKNGIYTVVLSPEYRDTLSAQETLESLLTCEDYNHVYVFGGLEKPFSFEWYKIGDDR